VKTLDLKKILFLQKFHSISSIGSKVSRRESHTENVDLYNSYEAGNAG